MRQRYNIESSEDMEQSIVMQWAQLNAGRCPELRLLHHIPNGGDRRTREGAKLKRMGVLAGVPDLHLPVGRGGFHSLYIEMKYDGGKVSAEQVDFMLKAAEQNNYCCVCYTAEDAIRILDEYTSLKGLSTMREPNLSVIKENKQTGTVKK